MKSRVPVIISLCVLAMCFVMKREDFPLVRSLRMQAFDYFITRHPRTYTPQPVSIVDFDEESLRRIGQWPWPRDKLAELSDKLTLMGASAIAWDVLFAEPDRTSPQAALKAFGNSAAIRELAKELPDHDALFAKTMGEGNTVASFVLLEEERPALPQLKAGFSFAGEDPRPFLPSFKGAATALPEFEKAARGNGALNSFPDQDGLLRRMPLMARIGDQFYPTLSAEALRVAQGASGYIIKSAGANGEENFGVHTGITAVKIGQLEIPTDSEGSFWIYYTPYVKERYIPAWKVLQPDFDPSLVEGHIVLMGTSSAGLKDIRATPLNPDTNGVEVHAQAIEQVLTGEYLLRPDWVEGAEDILMVGAGLMLVFVMARFSATAAAGFTALALVFAALACWRAFKDYHLLIDPVTPGITILLLYLTGSLLKYITSEREKKYIKQAFQQYMSPELLKQLSADPDKLKLGGEMRDLSLLFCDIRGFTSLSETMDAHELTVFINKFLTPMTDVILANKGTIDKYMGDAIMAFWNAPLDDHEHARHAADAALAMQKELKAMNQGKRKKIEIGIGLNTGRCCVGNMGSDQRFDYSALGDHVNLASRLEGQSKTYGVPILVGEATAEALGEEYATLELDQIRVKGKKKAVRIFALLGGQKTVQDKGFQHFRTAFLGMLESYRKRQWNEAARKLTRCKKLRNLSPVKVDEPLQLYASRITQYKKNPPSKDWDGVFEAVSK